jgi:hypothetical protein
MTSYGTDIERFIRSKHQPDRVSHLPPAKDLEPLIFGQLLDHEHENLPAATGWTLLPAF